MAGRGSGPDFVEALARGLDILAALGAEHRSMSLSEVAAAASLARPTARRLLLTLEELGFVRSGDGTFELTPKVMNLGMAYVSSLGLWDIARPHLEALVARTGESSSMAQLDGADIVYVARVSASSSRSCPSGRPIYGGRPDRLGWASAAATWSGGSAASSTFPCEVCAAGKWVPISTRSAISLGTETRAT